MSSFVPKVRFLVTSDIHVKPEKDCPELSRFRDGMKYAYKYASESEYDRIDALFVVGDFANHGQESEMSNFKEALDECIPKDTDITISLASHEYTNGEDEAKERFKRIFDMDYDCHKVINGFHFISLSSTHGCSYKEPQIQFAKTELAKAFDDNEDAPIFFFQHPHISGTVYGSINWGNDTLYPVLMNYPQVVNFSGHSHAPINDPRSAHQQHFSSFGTGSFSYFELDEFDKYYGTIPPDAQKCAQFLIVEADAQNRVRVKPFDVLTGKFFPYVWKIDNPCEPSTFLYTDKRYKTNSRPHFHCDTHVSVSKIENGVNLTFGQAEISEDRVDDYKITVRRKNDGKIVKQISMWSDYYLYDMPESLTVDILDLKPGKYEAEIIASGFWKNRSDNSLKIGFEV